MPPMTLFVAIFVCAPTKFAISLSKIWRKSSVHTKNEHVSACSTTPTVIIWLTKSK